MTDKQIRNEEQIIRLVQSGDTTAMRSLYNLHIRYLTAVCARYLARDEDVKDALQEAFLKIFTSIGRFKYRGEGSLRAWMTRIVINEALKLLRREQRIDTVDLRREHTDTADEEPATEEILWRAARITFFDTYTELEIYGRKLWIVDDGAELPQGNADVIVCGPACEGAALSVDQYVVVSGSMDAVEAADRFRGMGTTAFPTAGLGEIIWQFRPGGGQLLKRCG